jgi:UDP-glucose 4-epimerase
MKVLIIGGTGFIGRHLCYSLPSRYQISVLSRRPPMATSSQSQSQRISYLTGDIAQANIVYEACSGVDCIVYLASTVIPGDSNKDPLFDIQSNLIGAINTLNAAIDQRVHKIVFASSGGTVYGNSSSLLLSEKDATNPICSYGIIKLAIEKYIAMYGRNHGLHYSILRLSNPYGPGHMLNKPQGVINHFVNRLRMGEKLEVWGDGSIERDYIYITDVIEAIQKCIETPIPSLLLNIGTGVPTSINELIRVISSEFGLMPEVAYSASRSFDVHKSALDIAAAKKLIDWSPRTCLRSGIRLILEYDPTQH